MKTSLLGLVCLPFISMNYASLLPNSPDQEIQGQEEIETIQILSIKKTEITVKADKSNSDLRSAATDQWGAKGALGADIYNSAASTQDGVKIKFKGADNKNHYFSQAGNIDCFKKGEADLTFIWKNHVKVLIGIEENAECK